MENNDYIYTLEIAVRDYELDSEGIVNNANYLHYLEMTRHEFCRWAGYSFKEMSADGIVPVLSRVEIDYKTPLRSGDVMLSSLWVEKAGSLAATVFLRDLRNGCRRFRHIISHGVCRHSWHGGGAGATCA